jgi:hypothetical protein
VIRALLAFSLGELEKRVVNDLAIELDELSLPVDRHAASLSDRWDRTLMCDANSLDRDVHEEDSGRTDPSADGSRQLRA